jgi:[CysO sulfur-carrier protein]-S-L-cysteine hydrolase
MVIAADLLADVIAHARNEYDLECCGLIAYEQGETDGARRAVRVHRAKNVHASRKRFEIDGKEVLMAEREFEDAGWRLGAIYHSHTHTAPKPSQTDVNFAARWPGVEWLIVGLAKEEPEVRCWAIEDGEVREVPVKTADAGGGT